MVSNIMIRANHLLRSSYKAMEEAAVSILAHDRSFESEAICAPTSKIFQVVGFDKIKEQDQIYDVAQRLSVIIPAAGKDPVFSGIPKSMVRVGGRPILDHQVERIRKSGLTNNKVVVVRGFEGGQFTRTDVEYFENPNYSDTHSLHSLFCAETAMERGFLLVYSDILFDEALVSRLSQSGEDIVLLLDNSYRYHTHEVDKKLELVVSDRRYATNPRRLVAGSPVAITRIGKEVPQQVADYEFVGLAYLSEKGAEIIRKVYWDALSKKPAPFHEAASFERASIVDIFQEVIDLGFPVLGMEVSTGWIEIHNQVDVAKAEQELDTVRAAGG